MTIYHGIGFVCGIVFVAVALTILRKTKKYEHYDERQVAARGKASAAGFIAFIICESAIFFIELVMGKNIDIFSPGTIHFLVIIISATVFAVTSIFKDAYFPANQKMSKRYFISTGCLTVLCVALLFKNKWIDENGQIGINMIYISVLGLLLTVMLAAIIRNAMTKRESEKEDD